VAPLNLLPQNKNVRLGLIIGCGVVALGLIVLIFAAGTFYLFKKVSNRAPQTSSSTVSSSVIKAANESCQISFPAGWASVPKLNGDAVLSAGDLKNIQYFIVICDPKDGVSREFRDYAETVSTAMVQRMQSATKTPARDLKINGKDAVRYNIIGSLNNNEFAFVLTLVDGTKYRYQLLGWSFKSKQESAAPVFESISQSWTELTDG
jgi:hypothetical protein